MLRNALAIAISALIALTGACNPFGIVVEEPLPLPGDLGPSRTIVLTNETGKPVGSIELAYSSERSFGSMTRQGSETVAEPDRHHLAMVRMDSPITIERLAVRFGTETVLLAENHQVDVPGDVEIVLKPDRSVVYRMLKEPTTK